MSIDAFMLFDSNEILEEVSHGPLLPTRRWALDATRSLAWSFLDRSHAFEALLFSAQSERAR